MGTSVHKQTSTWAGGTGRLGQTGIDVGMDVPAMLIALAGGRGVGGSGSQCCQILGKGLRAGSMGRRGSGS